MDETKSFDGIRTNNDLYKFVKLEKIKINKKIEDLSDKYNKIDSIITDDDTGTKKGVSPLDIANIKNCINTIKNAITVFQTQDRSNSDAESGEIKKIHNDNDEDDNDDMDLDYYNISKKSQHDIPSYDLKFYSNTINELAANLNKTLNTINRRFNDSNESGFGNQFWVKKFYFRNKPAKKLQSDYLNLVSNSRDSHEFDITTNALIPTLSGINNQRVFIDPETTTENVFIKDIRKSIIEIPKLEKTGTTNNLNSVHLVDISDSVVILHAKTYVLIENLQNCVIIGTSQQFRIHNCNNCKFALDVNKEIAKHRRIIIENCDNLIIFKLSNVILNSGPIPTNSTDFVIVDDFNFQNSENTVNPHFTYSDEKLDLSNMGNLPYGESIEDSTMNNFII
ncbi:hypothetical protein BVG19_g3799 [[Candida] boidinii]|nr:hypothetical protein BVG19_g3799 [[Candida] boidinii]OWB50518.1 hypothetical protein B5S27_g2068 [[Candida] boidinii]OWB66030.1 hypothetical protein B5S30_g1364 [[Candida] boidinii]